MGFDYVIFLFFNKGVSMLIRWRICRMYSRLNSQLKAEQNKDGVYTWRVGRRSILTTSFARTCAIPLVPATSAEKRLRNTFSMSFISDLKPVQRATGIAILAATACGGIYYAAQSGALVQWGLPYLKPWQVLTLASYAINSAVISLGGRLDEGIANAEKPEDEPLPVVRYFKPAGWAFGIWGPIFIGEAALAIYQALSIDSVSAATEWLSRLSPWLAGAFVLQMGWCFTFREWARDSGLLWFAAVLLGGTALSLGGAHQVLRGAWANGDISTLQYVIVHLPVSLHFGWVSCATLVNFNNYISVVPRFSDNGKLGFSLLSIGLAVCLAVGVTVSTGDPVYAGVVAWALTAVGSEQAWAPLKSRREDMAPPMPSSQTSNATPLLAPAASQGRVEKSTLETQAFAARIGAGISAATAVATPLIFKKMEGK